MLNTLVINTLVRNRERILASFIITILILYLFRGSFDLGMQFDEVFRLNNLIPFINEKALEYDQSIFSINILGIKIPLMYKLYVSSVHLLLYLPLLFFKNYLIGIRSLHLIYFLISILCLYMITSKFNKSFALILCVLIITSPILYPEIKVGFVSTHHITFFSLSFYFFYKYFEENDKLKYLFLAVFFLFFAANVQFYAIWVITSVTITSIVFFWSLWSKILLSLKRIGIILTGVFLGLFNYILFNTATGFSTFKPLFYKIFKPELYNKSPIDYKESLPLFAELKFKLVKLMDFYGNNYKFIVFICAFLAVIYIFSFIKLIQQKQFYLYKIYFFPAVNLLLILLLILISPNTTRPGHYVYLVPFLELTILFGFILINKIYKIRYINLISALIISLLIVSNFYSSNQIINQVNKSKGEGYFSPVIYDLNDFINNNSISSDNIIHIQWGLYSQLYFLNKGEYKINSLVFQLKEAKDINSKIKIYEDFFRSYKVKNKLELFFPIYANLDKEQSEAFFKFVEKYDGNLNVIRHFYETNGEEILTLYKINNVQHMISNIYNEYSNVPISNMLAIIDYGPKIKNYDDLEDFGLWVITKNHSQNTVILLNNILLKTVYYEDHLTALIPKDVINYKGTYKIELYDNLKHIKSKPVLLEISK